MSRIGSIVLFALFALSFIGGLHYYFWVRLVRDTALPQPWRQLATATLWILGLSMPMTMILWRTHSFLGRRLAWPAFIWMGMLIILPTVLVATDALRLAFHFGGGARDPERRLLFRRALGAAAATVAAGLGALAIREGTRGPKVHEVEVTLDKLPRALDGFTIVQLTDVHVGPTIGHDFLQDVVARTNQLSPDVIAITGDLVDGSVAELRTSIAPLAQLRAKKGVFFVTGNHEYYAGVDEWLAHLTTLDVRVLRNERVSLADGLELAGIDDLSGHSVAGHGADLPRALAGRDGKSALVLMAHQPRVIKEAAGHGVGLQLSGHTHGGQIWPWNFAVYLQQPYVAGLAKHKDTQIYVSRGTGYWGPPMRLGAPSEITRITLRAPA
jgi:uncharacterized protein